MLRRALDELAFARRGKLALAPLALVLALGGCHRNDASAGADAGPDAAAAIAEVAASDGGSATPSADKPLLGVTAFVATVYKEPRDTVEEARLPPRRREGRALGRAGRQGRLPGRLVRDRAARLRLRRRGGHDSISTHPMLKARRATPQPQDGAPVPLRLRARRAAALRARPHRGRAVQGRVQAQGAPRLVQGERGRGLQGDRSAPTTSPSTSAASRSPTRSSASSGLGKNSQEVGIGALLGGEGEDDPHPVLARGRQATHPQHQRLQDPRASTSSPIAPAATPASSLIGSFPDGPRVAEPPLRHHGRSAPRAGEQDQARHRLAVARRRAHRRAHAAARLRAIAGRARVQDRPRQGHPGRRLEHRTAARAHRQDAHDRGREVLPHPRQALAQPAGRRPRRRARDLARRRREGQEVDRDLDHQPDARALGGQEAGLRDARSRPARPASTIRRRPPPRSAAASTSATSTSRR